MPRAFSTVNRKIIIANPDSQVSRLYPDSSWNLIEIQHENAWERFNNINYVFVDFQRRFVDFDNKTDYTVVFLR